ncbi:TPA: hypothetical protein ACT5B2_003854 [Burkholderia cenocepacia]|uniref:hypothetical protein n=1 Tax=Burkholderia cenocepacia TaxID=95486 RepID=UPI002AB79416|nr:hypothetical protein [Burkholderia cenocepacia]
MNTMKHSPGPWEWVGNCLESKAPGHYESVLEAKVSCSTFCYGGTVELTISDADRKLMEACPDLLMVLEIIAADDDAERLARRKPLLTSGVRTALDAVLIKAGRKSVPERHPQSDGSAT